MAGKPQGSLLPKKKIKPKTKVPPRAITTSRSFDDLLLLVFSCFAFLSLLPFLPISLPTCMIEMPFLFLLD